MLEVLDKHVQICPCFLSIFAQENSTAHHLKELLDYRYPGLDRMCSQFTISPSHGVETIEFFKPVLAPVLAIEKGFLFFMVRGYSLLLQ